MKIQLFFLPKQVPLNSAIIFFVSKMNSPKKYFIGRPNNSLKTQIDHLHTGLFMMPLFKV